MKKLLPILYTLYSLLSTATPTQAQEVSLAISPPVIEILLAPNKQVKQTFTVKVKGENQTVIPSLHLVKPVGNTGHSQIDLAPLNPSSIPLSISSSIPLDLPHKLTTDTFDLTLTLEAASLDIATDVYLALVVRVVPRESSISNLSSSTLPGISALILTTINPTGVMPIGLEIQNFDLPLVHDTWTPFTSTPELKNSVDQMIRPEGKYEIFSPTGKSIFSQDLYPSLILGNSSRLLQGTEPCKNEQGSVPCNPLPLTFTPDWSTIGPHRVKLMVITQGGTKLTEIERMVWFLPLRAALLLISLFLLFLGISHYNRRRTHIDP